MTIKSIKKYFKLNMASLEFRFKKKIDETKNFLIEEKKHNDLISENIRRHVSV